LGKGVPLNAGDSPNNIMKSNAAVTNKYRAANVTNSMLLMFEVCAHFQVACPSRASITLTEAKFPPNTYM
jgi:hypothetical protein